MQIATPTLNHTSSADWEFVYEPAEDSFLLIDAIEADLSLVKQRQPSICLEVGSGSGIVLSALATALRGNAFCVATDLNPAACGLTQRTARANNADVDIIQADLLPFRPGAVDLVLFNPPYVPTSSSEVSGQSLERSWAGGRLGREVIDRFLDVVIPALSPTGLGYLLLLQENNPDEVTTILEKAGCRVSQVAQRRIRGESLIVLRFEKHLTLL